MGDFLTTIRVFHGEIVGFRINLLHVHAPALRRIRKRLLPVNKVSKVGIVERVGFPHVPAGIELVEPNLPGRRAFFEKQNHGFHARALEGTAGAIEHGVEIAALEQEFPQADGGVVGVAEEGVLDDDASAAPSFEDFDEMLEEEEGGLAGADGEIFLHFLALLAAEGWIGEDDVEAVFFLHAIEVLGEGVGVDDVRCLDAVEDHVHDRDNVGEGLLFLSEKRALLQGAILRGAALGILGAKVVEGLAKESRRADRRIADRFSKLRRGDGDNGADERARGVILAAIAPGVPHVLDLGLVKVR